jgi:hypothetical protein
MEVTDIQQDNGIMVKPVKIVRQDGTIETVYMDATIMTSKQPWSQRAHYHVTMVYMLVSTAALLLTAYLTYVHIKNKE